MVLALFLAFILVLAHIFSEKYSSLVERFHIHTISFSAGLFLGVIFLSLLPEFIKGADHLGDFIYLLMFAGFVLFHLGEKYVYQHVKNKNELLKDLASVHALGFFINHFVVGVTLFLVFSQVAISAGFLIFVPLLLHTLSSSLSLNHLDKRFSIRSPSGFLLPLSPFLGAAFATVLSVTLQHYHAMLSFVVGAMLYIVIRDTIPRKEKGKPLHFLIGALLSVVAITLMSLL